MQESHELVCWLVDGGWHLSPCPIECNQQKECCMQSLFTPDNPTVHVSQFRNHWEARVVLGNVLTRYVSSFGSLYT